MTVETPGFEIAIGSRRTAARGTVRVGQPDRPARIEVASFDPPELGDVRIPLQGWHVSYAPPDGKLAIEDLAFALVLGRAQNRQDDRQVNRQLNLEGRIEVENIVVDPFGESGGEPGARDDRWKEAAKRVGLDLRVRGPDALRVKLPVLPDPTIGFACRVTGTAASPVLAGRVRGADPYSRLLVRAFDLFSSMDVRRCVNGQI